MITWNFSGRVVAITGGAGGLGLPLTRAYLDSGARVHICGVEEAQLADARRAFAPEHEAGRLQTALVDVREPQQVRDWLQRAAAAEGRLDILVNAAGVCSTVPTAEVDETLWDRIVDVNLKGTFFASQTAAELMKENGYGRIVNLSSLSAYNGGVLVSAPYGATKAGVIALAKSFAALYSRYGICVNAVSPGPFKTDMILDFPEEGVAGMIARTPNGRIGEPADIVQSILFLSDESSSHITGAVLDINGGIYMR